MSAAFATILVVVSPPKVSHAATAFQPATNVIGQDDGTVSTPAPIYTKGTVSNAAHKLGLNAPIIGIVMDTVDHRLFLSDTTNNRVLVYNLDASNALLDRVPDNVLGQLNFYTNAVATTQIGLSAPNGLEYDSTNKRLFVVDTTNNRVKVYDVTTITDGQNAVNVLGQALFTTATAATTQEGMNVPTGVTYDATGNRLFVAQNTANRVTVYDVANVEDGEAATGVLGQADFVTATAATTQAGMNVPFDLALSGTTLTTLFVSQGTANRVTTYDVTVVTNGENAVKVLGQANFTATTAAVTQAGMSGPRGIAYDSIAKKLYVSQNAANRVTVYNTGDGITDGENAVNVLGQANFTATTAAVTQAGMSSPTGAYVDKPNSKLYVPQSGASRVSIFDVASITDGENAVDAIGQSDDSLASPAPIYTKGTANNLPYKLGLNVPWGVCIDSVNHRLFVADSSNNRVLVYNLTADNLLTDRIPDNVLGQAFYYKNAVGTTQSTMSLPISVAFDSSGNRLFVADTTNNRILVFDTASITDGENAVNVLGQISYVAATAGTTQIGLSVPRQITYDGSSGLLYVADATNNRVVIYDVTTVVDGEGAVNVIGQDDGLVGSPSPIYTKGTANNAAHKLGLNAPIIGIAMDTVGHRLFVSDTSNNRVLEYDLNSSNVLVDRVPDHVIGQLNFYGNTAATTRAGLNVPNGLAYDSAGKRLFVVQSTGNRVTVYDVTTITDGQDATNVLGQTSYTVATATNTQFGFNVPTGAVYDQTNNRLFVAQNTGNRVTVFNLGVGYVDGMNADNLIGQYDDSLSAPAPIYTKTTAQNGPSKLGLNAPVIGIVMDTVDHRLFLSDTTNNRVLVYNLDANNALLDRIPDNVLGQTNFYSSGAATTQIGMSAPNGLEYDSTGKRLFVADTSNNRIKVYDATTITDGEDAANVIGQSSFTVATAATTQAGLNVPTGVAYGGSGSRLYVAQNTGNRVTIFNISDGITNGENAVAVLGQTDFVTATAATTQAGMNVPFDLALSGTTLTTLFVSQGTANRVTAYDVTSVTNGENAVNVLGQANFVTSLAIVSQAGMSAPRGIAYDSITKKLYVSQTTANRVTVYNTGDGIADGENAINVLGQNVFINSVTAVTQGGMSAPTGVYIDKANSKLYVPQSGANRVSIFDVASITDGENAVDALGQYDDSLSDPAPIYTKGNVHNGPNNLGLNGGVIGLALDPTDHRLFVSDTGNNRVLEYDLNSSNLLVDRVPDHVLGQPDFHTSTAATTQAGMNVPNGLAYNDAGNLLFVAQTTGNRVTVYDVTAITDGENAVNVLGQANFTSTTAATTQAGMNVPTGVAYGGSGSRLYVAQNTGNRVTAYNVADGITDGENAVAVLGQTNYTNTTAATTQAGMNVPYDVTLSGSVNTTLFVSQSAGNRVTTYDVTKITDGENAVNVLGQTTFIATTAATTRAGMNAPRGISYDATNKRLYVAQLTGVRVTSYDLSNGLTDGENAANVIGQALFTTSTAAVAQEGLSAPTGVLTDPANSRVYVLDSTANRVLSYPMKPGIANGKPASNVLGQTTFTVVTAATTQAGMSSPFDVAISGSTLTTLFVSDGTNNRVLTYDVTAITDGENAVSVLGQTLFTVGTAATTQAGMNGPRGISYNPLTKTLFVSQTTANRVTTYDVANITNGENAVKVIGQPSFTTATAAARQAGLSAPTGAFIDPANNLLYVPQSGASRVSIFNVASITDGENATNMLGQTDNDLNPPGPIYTKGTANNASYKMGLSSPQGVAVDTVNHRLFVSDSTNNRVLVYNMTSGNVLSDTFPDNVLGQPNFYSNAIATTQTGLSAPMGLAFDPGANKLYVSDFTNNRVMIFDTTSITDGENAIGVLGQPSFLVLTAASTQAGLSGPRHLAFDSTSGQLFVADSANSRITVYKESTSGSSGTSGGNSFYFFGF